MIRVTKPNGVIFGTENMYPQANPYNDLHFKVIKGAHGFFSRKEFENWAKSSGANSISFCTPISLFKIVK